MKIQELLEGKGSKPDLIEILQAFLPFAVKELNLPSIPKIKLHLHLGNDDQPSFGRFNNETHVIDIAIEDRHPLDILRTLAHELVHYKQELEVGLDSTSGETGSPEENQAHELAGIVMRHFNKANPQFFQSDAINLEENFADGRNPQDKGDAKRHGVPTKASVSTLRKVAKQGGRKGQLAHWMANMKAGRAKKK